MENPLSQNLLFLVMADISAIGPQRVKEAIVDLRLRLKGNSKCISSYLLSSLGA